MAGDLAVKLVTRYVYGSSSEVSPWQRLQSGCATCVVDDASEACARCACSFRMRARQWFALGSFDRSRGSILPRKTTPCAGSNPCPNSTTRRATIESEPRRCRDRCSRRRLRQAAPGGRGPDRCNSGGASLRGGLPDDVDLGRRVGPSRHDRAVAGEWLARALASDDRQAGHSHAQPNIGLHRAFECLRDGACDGRVGFRDRCRRLRRSTSARRSRRSAGAVASTVSQPRTAEALP